MFGKIRDFLFGAPESNNQQGNQNQGHVFTRSQPKAPTPLWILILNTVFPTLCAVAYVLLGIFLGLWHPGWLIFLLVPLYYSFAEAIKRKDPAAFAYPVLVVGVYLLVGFMNIRFFLLLIPIFVSIPVYYVICAAIKKKNVMWFFDCLVPIFCVIGYLLLGFLGGWWHPGWVIFFAIPLYYQTASAIKKYKKEKQAAEYGAPGQNDYSKVETMTAEEYAERRKK